MRGVLALVAVLLPCAACTSVIGYLPEWRYGSFNFDTAAATVTHLLFFSLEPGPNGELLGMDRFPNTATLLDARAAQKKHGKGKQRLVICFGGNGRSTHFAAMSRNADSRSNFVKNVADLLERKKLDGVDINWEYPGFAFGAGYADNFEDEWKHFAQLMRDLRAGLVDKVLTLAYYPDGKQEGLLVKLAIHDHVDLMHAMSYDAPGPQHSPLSLAQRVIDNAVAAGLPIAKVAIGVPFYGRKGNDWVTYEDIVQLHKPLAPQTDSVDGIGFNGKETIRRKTLLARQHGAHVMVWELGQDCRIAPVTRNDRTHGITCPNGDTDSLLSVIRDALASRDDEL